MSHPNLLLARLSAALRNDVSSHMTTVSLERGRVLAETHSRISNVYFPHSGVLSCVVETLAGGAVETGMIGRDGQFGAGSALDHRLSLNTVIVQIAGEASVIPASAVKRLALNVPEFHQAIISYEQFLIGQIQQTAACNALHQTDARLCKWFLRMHSLAGPELDLIQEFLAQMLGVQRTSVSSIANDLQRAGMISYSRGKVRLLDVEKIRRTSCECETAVRSHYRALFPDKS